MHAHEGFVQVGFRLVIWFVYAYAGPAVLLEIPGSPSAHSRFPEKSMYIFGEVRKVSHGAGFAEFSSV